MPSGDGPAVVGQGRSASSETPDGAAADFFISYSQADVDWARWIAWQLEEAGWTVVIQAWDFQTGTDFVQAMHRHVEAARRLLLVLSADALASRYVGVEWAAVLAADPTGELGRLLPVRVRPCEPGGLLRSRAYVDLVGLTAERATAALLEGAAGTRRKPSAAPAHPTAKPDGGPAAARVVLEEPDWPGRVSRWSGAMLRRALRAAVVSAAVAACIVLIVRSGLPELFEMHRAATVSFSLVAGGIAAAVLESTGWLLRRSPRRKGAP